jgi:hypothetical protein
MNPISLVRLHKLLLPSPRSHWSATGPRSKTQPTATWHTQRKPTRPSCWHLKPVRPISETSQTASVGLSLSTSRWNRLDQFGKPVRPVLSRNSPKHLRGQNYPKTPQEPLLLWIRKTIARQRPSCSKTLHDSPEAKPVRPVWEKLNFSSDRSPNSFHGSK